MWLPQREWPGTMWVYLWLCLDPFCIVILSIRGLGVLNIWKGNSVVSRTQWPAKPKGYITDERGRILFVEYVLVSWGSLWHIKWTFTKKGISEFQRPLISRRYLFSIGSFIINWEKSLIWNADCWKPIAWPRSSIRCKKQVTYSV